MSIRSSLQSHAGSAGLLTHLQPLLGGPVVRELYVYRDVMQAISGPWRDDDDRVACSFLRRELDRFVEGQVVSLALQPFRKRADAAVAILHPPQERVFDFRVREPYPGVRVFGCFADRDLFVATNWERRDLLPSVTPPNDDADEWKMERQICLTRSRQVASPYDPYEGNTVNDYISNGIPA